MDRFIFVAFLFIGVSFLFMEEYSFRGVSLRTEDYPSFQFAGIAIVLISLYMLYSSINNKESKKNNSDKFIEFSKCPKCKKTFNYQDLDKGKCPKCKNIDTIDLEEYFEIYPKEKKK